SLVGRDGDGGDDRDAEATPIWKEVLLRPEATPDSRSGTPARAAIEAVTKARPTPGPKTSRPKKMSPGIEGEGEGEPVRERAEDEHDRVRGDASSWSEDR